MFQVNLEYLESKLESIDGEEVQRIQDNINSLFHHCVQALGEEHQIKVVNALQVTKAQEDHLQVTLQNLPSRQMHLKYDDDNCNQIMLACRIQFCHHYSTEKTWDWKAFSCLCVSFSNTCAPLLLSTDSLRTFPGGSPEEQVRVWLWHHQHAHGVRQGRAKDEGAWAGIDSISCQVAISGSYFLT